MTTSRHVKALDYLRLGLLVGVKSFSELERRIESLSDEKQRGDAFEVFAEAYLATQRVGMAKQVWPDKSIPPSLRKRLRLSARDVGADGVIETASGLSSEVPQPAHVTNLERHSDLLWSH